MEFNFNKIKRWMEGDQGQPLPPELDWNNMKDGIFDKMQSLEQEQFAQEKDKNPRRRILLLLLLLIGISLGVYSISHYRSDSSDNAAMQIMPSELEHKNKVDQTTETSSTIQIANKEKAKKSTIEKNNSKNESPLQEVTNDTKAQIQASKNKANTQTNNKRQQNLLTKVVREDSMEKIQTGQNSTALYNTLRAPGTEDVTAKEEQIFVKESAPALLPFANNFVVEKNKDVFDLLLVEIQPGDEQSTSKPNRSKSPDQLIIEGGITLWDQGYGKDQPVWAQYETTLPSFQIQGFYKKNFKGDYFAMAGLQYQQLESKFNYNTTIEDYLITIEDTIVQVQNDLISGQTTVIYGDVEQTVQAERRIVHFNRSQMVRVSLGVGKSWRFKSWQADVYLGGALNSLVHNQGRNLNDDTIIDYNGASNPLFTNQSKIDAMLGLRFHYLLTGDFGFTAGFQVQRSVTNWSKQADTNMYPVSYGLQLGLSYSL